MTTPPSWFHRLRPWLLKVLLLAGILGSLAAVAVGLRLNDWPAQRFLWFYLAPIPVVVAWWLNLRLRTLETSTSLSRIVDLTVLAMAASRLAGAAFPASGHMLWLTYSGNTTDHRGFQAMAVVLIAETTYFKLVVWDDRLSWTWGLLLGAAMAVLHFYATKRPPQAT